jgi:hypothetical protein
MPGYCLDYFSMAGLDRTVGKDQRCQLFPGVLEKIHLMNTSPFASIDQQWR